MVWVACQCLEPGFQNFLIFPYHTLLIHYVTILYIYTWILAGKSCTGILKVYLWETLGLLPPVWKPPPWTYLLGKCGSITLEVFIVLGRLDWFSIDAKTTLGSIKTIDFLGGLFVCLDCLGSNDDNEARIAIAKQIYQRLDQSWLFLTLRWS